MDLQGGSDAFTTGDGQKSADSLTVCDESKPCSGTGAFAGPTGENGRRQKDTENEERHNCQSSLHV
jgi:hypothetical protein